MVRQAFYFFAPAFHIFAFTASYKHSPLYVFPLTSHPECVFIHVTPPSMHTQHQQIYFALSQYFLQFYVFFFFSIVSVVEYAVEKMIGLEGSINLNKMLSYLLPNRVCVCVCGGWLCLHRKKEVCRKCQACVKGSN